MNHRIRKMIAVACALACAMVFAEPGARPAKQLDAASWQKYWGSEYNVCEGCCGMGFCCNLEPACMHIVD